LGSLEYAVDHLHVPLLLVLGHDDCGAVKAAIESSGKGAVGDLIEHVRFAVEHVLNGQKDPYEICGEAVRANVLRTMGDLVGRSSVIARAIHEGHLILAGALFSLGSGKVSVLEIQDGRFKR
jgi:carbonic anhydrase